jgi:hypothetical protein
VCIARGGVVMSGKTNLSSLQMSRKQGICVTPASMKKTVRQPSMPYLSVLSPLRSHNSLALLLRRFFCLEDSKRLVRRDHISNIIIYLNVADFTSSSCKIREVGNVYDITPRSPGRTGLMSTSSFQSGFWRALAYRSQSALSTAPVAM